MGGGSSEGSAGGKDVVEYLVAGSGAAAVSRTCIAPIERVKIIYQTSRQSGYLSIAPRILREEGAMALWKGNTIAVIRVMPYLSVQFTSNELYRSLLNDALGSTLAPPIRNLLAGGMAGCTAVASTYPLDTVRARLAVEGLKASKAAPTGMFAKVWQVWGEEGAAALYRGCWISCVGGAMYTGLKFMTYDAMKSQFHLACGVTSDRELRVWQRAVSGAAGGILAQTLCYPFDVIRRRMQTAKGDSPYRGILHGFATIAREEGIYLGLYRGLSLNYLKTIPNVALYLSLYDVFKYWLLELRCRQ